jgi:hypothetical protein
VDGVVIADGYVIAVAEAACLSPHARSTVECGEDPLTGLMSDRLSIAIDELVEAGRGLNRLRDHPIPKTTPPPTVGQGCRIDDSARVSQVLGPPVLSY